MPKLRPSPQKEIARFIKIPFASLAGFFRRHDLQFVPDVLLELRHEFADKRINRSFIRHRSLLDSCL